MPSTTGPQPVGPDEDEEVWHLPTYLPTVRGASALLPAPWCLLEQENDQAQLRLPSPGKLVTYLVKNG